MSRFDPQVNRTDLIRLTGAQAADGIIHPLTNLYAYCNTHASSYGDQFGDPDACDDTDTNRVRDAFFHAKMICFYKMSAPINIVYLKGYC